MYLGKHVSMCKRIHVSVLTYKHVNINMYTPYPPLCVWNRRWEHMEAFKYIRAVQVRMCTGDHVKI